MELKRNEATINRPEGDRTLDAPFVHIDLHDFIKQVKDEKAWDKNDRNGITVFKSDQLTVVITCLQKGAEIKDNVVNDLMTVQVLDGKIKVFIEGHDEMKIREEEMITIHANVKHTIEASKDSALLIQVISCSGENNNSVI
jgi:quercetin dioxygenase-like cupin family protein